MSAPEPLILVVDDEKPILKVLLSSFRTAGYRVGSASTGADALRAVAKTSPDVIVLDLGLPDMDGKDVIISLREWTQAPILVLSARHDESERIAALDIGADDYVSKPFHMGELQARLRAALRHHARRLSDAKDYSGGSLNIEFAKRRVTIDGQEVRLTRKEFDLLHTLAQHAGQVVTHKQLLAAGWGSSVTDTQFVRVYVGQIRQKIEADASAPTLILTEPGIGYRLAAE